VERMKSRILFDEELAHSVSCAVAVGKSVFSENGILCPGTWFTFYTSFINSLPLLCEPPIGIENRCGAQLSFCDREVWRINIRNRSRSQGCCYAGRQGRLGPSGSRVLNSGYQGHVVSVHV
jgi:hypothetical protein